MNIFTPLNNFSKVRKILLSLLTLIIFQTGFAFGQDAPFITVWQTDNEGTSEDNQITIPGTGTDYLIEWEEVGNEASNNGSETGTDTHTITFPSAGTYRVKISGDFHSISFYNEGDKEKFLDIEQWGDIAWSSLSFAFYGCSNFNQTALDNPNLSDVKDLVYTFHGATSFNGAIEDWDVSNVTNMEGAFLEAASFNRNLENWDVSNVTNMREMFYNANSFNSNLGNWDVSNVTTMFRMFSLAYSFDGDISSWNVSKVNNMYYMFNWATSFNANISNWDVDNVEDMTHMFFWAENFDQDLGAWNLSEVNTMIDIFRNSNMSKDNYDNTLIGWSNQESIPENIDLGYVGFAVGPPVRCIGSKVLF